jgi:hypothetical protein
MSKATLISLDELTTTFEAYAGPDYPRERPESNRRKRGRLVWLIAAALVFAGAAYASGFNPFAGIGAANHAAGADDELAPEVLAKIQSINDRFGHESVGQLIPDSTRFVTELSSGTRIYAVATTTNELCVLSEEPPGSRQSLAIGCGDPLNQSRPTTEETVRPDPSTPPLTFGVAIDGVVAVSFVAEGVTKTVPVTDNVWAYEGVSDAMSRLVVHFAGGATEIIAYGS